METDSLRGALQAPLRRGFWDRRRLNLLIGAICVGLVLGGVLFATQRYTTAGAPHAVCPGLLSCRRPADRPAAAAAGDLSNPHTPTVKLSSGYEMPLLGLVRTPARLLHTDTSYCKALLEAALCAGHLGPGHQV